MDSQKLIRKVGRLTFSNPLVYGGGTMKSLDDVVKMCTSAAAGGEVGTITPHPKEGNSGRVFYAHYVKGVLIYTLNSIGLKNPGKAACSAWAKEAIKHAHDAGKLLGINIAADTISEMVEMYLWAVGLGFDWITINAGCPNKFALVAGKQVPQAILSFDTGDTERLMTALEIKAVGSNVETWWKPSPDNDTLGMQMERARIVAECSVITGWVANNTVPHCLAWHPHDHRTATTPGSGLAGMAGPALMPKTLGDLQRLRDILPEGMYLVGAGGVTYGQDILGMLRSGASIAQFTSALWAGNFEPRVADDMLANFCELPETEQFLTEA